MFRPLACAASAVALFFSGAAAAQAPAKPDAAKGQSIASQTCAACHAADGNSPLAANPKLAGQFYDYLHKQLVNFKPQDNKKAARDNAVMAGMVANLSAADLQNVASYYAAQKLKPAMARDKELAAQGQRIYRGGNAATGVAACAGCHGPSGAGIPAQIRGFPDSSRVCRGTAEGVRSGGRTKRSERHDARRRGAHDRREIQGGRRVRRRPR